jgi:hypothetical protein
LNAAEGLPFDALKPTLMTPLCNHAVAMVIAVAAAGCAPESGAEAPKGSGGKEVKDSLKKVHAN